MEIEDDDLGEEPTEEDLYAFGLDKMPRNNSSDETESSSYIQPSLSGSLIETASLVLHSAATRAEFSENSEILKKVKNTMNSSEIFQTGIEKVKEVREKVNELRDSVSGLRDSVNGLRDSVNGLRDSVQVPSGSEFMQKMAESMKETELFQYLTATPERPKNIWCTDTSIMRGKKLCSYLVFVLKFFLTIDAISNILPLFYEFVCGACGRVSTIGGKHDSKTKILDGPLEDALFDNPFGIHFDANWNLLISEFGSHTIRIITPDDYIVKTISGKPHEKGSEDGEGTEALFWIPVQFAEDKDGHYIVVDSFNNNYRRITFENGVYNIKTLDLGISPKSSLPNEVNACHDIYLDRNGHLIGSDTCNHRIIKIIEKDQLVEYAGLGFPGYRDGPLEGALFNKPSGIVVDRFGDIIVCDYQNHCIRKIRTQSGTVETIAGQGEKEGFKDGKGSEALFCHPNAVCLGLDDTLIIADTDNHCIRQISRDGYVTTIAGIPTEMGNADGKPSEATFHYPVNLCIDARGDIFIADWKNNLLRKFTYDY